MKRKSMTHQMYPFAVVVVFFLAACAPQQRSASEQQGDATAVRSAIEDVWREYSDSLNAGDLDRWLSLWTEDGVQMPPNEPAVVGKERIAERVQGFVDRFAFDISITNEEVGAAGEWAYARGVYAATLTPKEGGDRVQIDGKYMTILRRQSDGSWKITLEMFNSSNTANGPGKK